MSPPIQLRTKGDSTDVSYDRILIPIAGSSAIDPPIRHGLSLGQTYGATIHALHVLEIGDDQWDALTTDIKEQKKWEAAEVTERIMGEAHTLGLPVIPAIKRGFPSDVIRNYAAENDIDLIVMGTRGRTGLVRCLKGSVSEQTIRSSQTPVLTVKREITNQENDSTPTNEYANILIPTDGSDEATVALEHGLETARRYGATVHALFIVDRRAYTSRPGFTWEEAIESWEQRGERVLSDVEERAAVANVDVQTTIIDGLPHREILEYTTRHDVDLVVMGTRGLTGINRLLQGSVSDQIIRNADVPVLTVPPRW